MYEHHSNRLIVSHSVNDDRLADVRRSHLLRVAREDTVKTERVQGTQPRRVAGRIGAAVAAVLGHTPPVAHPNAAR